MKRKEQLIRLSKDHHQSLVLAKKCINTHASNDADLIALLCQSIVESFDAVWEKHFAIEEEGVFKQAAAYSDQLNALCQQLIDEHQQLRSLKENMARGDYSCLGEFGEILKRHTRVEERELFPLVEHAFSETELELVRVLSE